LQIGIRSNYIPLLKIKRKYFQNSVSLLFKRLIFFSLILLSKPIFAETGIFNLNPEAITELNGEWFITKNKTIDTQWKNEKQNLTETVIVPAYWRKIGLLETKVAVYTSKILIPKSEKDTDLAIYSPAIMEAYEIYWNGVLIGKDGILDSHGEVLKANSKINFYPISKSIVQLNSLNTLEIVVANKFNNAGITSTIYIGKLDLIKSKFLFYIFRKIGGGVFIILLGFFYLVYSIFHTKERAYLIFSISCIITPIYILGVERISNWLIDDFRIYLLSMDLALVASYFLYHFLVLNYFSFEINLFDKFYFTSLLFILFSILFFYSSEKLFLYRSTILLTSYLFILPTIYTVFIMRIIQAVNQKKMGAKIFLFTVLFFSIMLIRTNYKFFFQPSDDLYLIESYALTFFCIILAISYKDATLKNRLYELEKNYSQQLKEEVRSKTFELEELHKMKDKLFSILSHDLRSPLDILKNQLLSFDLKKMKKTEIEKYIHSISKSVDENHFILDNILNWSHKQIKERKIDYQIFEVNSIIKEIVDLFNERASKKKIQIEFNYKKPLLVKSDRGIFKLVMVNLLNNAIKYSYESSNIKIQSFIKQDKVFVSVMDQGIGLPKNRDEIFNLQNNISRSGTSEEKGVGIGLYLCKDFLSIMGEEITAENRKPRGAKFQFSIKRIS
jgi:signal transduction histidine kinase